MKASQQPPIVQAAQEQTTATAALAYAALGLSIIPLDGKPSSFDNVDGVPADSRFTGDYSGMGQCRTAEEHRDYLWQSIGQSGCP